MIFLHPELFDAAICVSGSPVPRQGDPQQNDMRINISTLIKQVSSTKHELEFP